MPADFKKPFAKQELSDSKCIDLARPRFCRETLEAKTSLSETFFKRVSSAESLMTLSIS
jgi:hypothetical protein